MRICKPTRLFEWVLFLFSVDYCETMKSKRTRANSQHPSSLMSRLQAGISMKSDRSIIMDDEVNDIKATKINI